MLDIGSKSDAMAKNWIYCHVSLLTYRADLSYSTVPHMSTAPGVLTKGGAWEQVNGLK